MSLLIKNALILKGSSFEKTDIFIDGSAVAGVGSFHCVSADSVFDFKNKFLVVPGFVDVHVHLRQPGFSYKETIKSGTMAAASAGYTAVCSMPNVQPVPDCKANLKVQTDIIKKDAVIDVFPYASITLGRRGAGECVDFAALKDSVIAFSDDGNGVQPGEVMQQAMKECASLGAIIAAHCEVDELLHGGYIHDGEYCKAHGHRGISSESEWREVERDCRLAEQTGCRFHVCHISTKESVEIIRRAKKRGVNVTCETAPHYLTLTDADLKENGAFKMNPPLRSEADRQALIEGVIDETIDIIATDHAPHSLAEKSKGLKGSAMGISGIETAFGVLYSALVKTGVITLRRLIDMMSTAPRKIFGIAGGAVETGAIADFAVLDLQREWTVHSKDFISMGQSTPFENKRLCGKNVMTIKRGQVIYDERV